MYEQPKCPYSYFSLALEFNFRVFLSLWVSLVMGAPKVSNEGTYYDV